MYVYLFILAFNRPSYQQLEWGWDIFFNNNLYGNFFMAYGVLYVLDSATNRDSRIR